MNSIINNAAVNPAAEPTTTATLSGKPTEGSRQPVGGEGQAGERVEVIDDLSVCVDCALYIANGDLPEEAADVAAIQAGEAREQPRRFVLSGGETEEAFFSWSPCDCCCRSLGGDRLKAALILVH